MREGREMGEKGEREGERRGGRERGVWGLGQIILIVTNLATFKPSRNLVVVCYFKVLVVSSNLNKSPFI